MENIIIRKAESTDLEALLAFEQAIVATERPFDETLKDGEIHYYDLKQMIASPDVEVVVAELNDEIIGSGYARIQSSKAYLKHQQHAYLGFMYVKPEYRGKGINKQIIEALEQWCRQKNITEIRLEVYSDNTPAIKAYEKIGFTRNLIEMRKELL